MELLIRVIAVMAVVAVGFLVMDAALLASEVEDCNRLTSQADAGYPVTVPDWCGEVYARAGTEVSR